MSDGAPLIWVNEDRTVMVSRYEDGMTIHVATRASPFHRWGPPIPCRADEETAKILEVGRLAADAAMNEMGMGEN